MSAYDAWDGTFLGMKVGLGLTIRLGGIITSYMV